MTTTGDTTNTSTDVLNVADLGGVEPGDYIAGYDPVSFASIIPAAATVSSLIVAINKIVLSAAATGTATAAILQISPKLHPVTAAAVAVAEPLLLLGCGDLDIPLNSTAAAATATLTVTGPAALTLSASAASSGTTGDLTALARIAPQTCEASTTGSTCALQLVPLALRIPTIAVTTDASAEVTISEQGLTVKNVIDDIFRLFGLCSCPPGDPCLKDEILHRLNASVQLMFVQAHRLDYFNRTTLQKTLAASASSTTFAATLNVQTILGPIRDSTTKLPLREIETRAQLDRATQTYFGSGTAPTEPRFYHVQRANTAAPDNCAITIYFAPASTAGCTLDIDVALNSPRYRWRDYEASTPLQIPHKYAESILMPILRKWATSSIYFSNKERLPEINSQYQLAIASLGMADPATPNKFKRDKDADKEEAK